MKRAGFTIVEIIIVVVIVGIIGALGFVGYRTLVQSHVSKPVTTPDAQAAQKLTQEFYAKYTNSQGGGADLVTQYGTTNLLAQSKTGSSSYSPIICAQYPAAVSTSSPTYVNGRYRVPVTLKLQPAVSFTAEVIKSGDAFKIDKVDCPPRPDRG